MVKFILKWFFPSTFSIMFYPSLIFGWFAIFDEWNRTWENFQNFSIFMVALFSIFYLALDDNDGRFTTFLGWLEEQNKWRKRLVTIIIFIAWGTLIAFVSHYFPVKT